MWKICLECNNHVASKKGSFCKSCYLIKKYNYKITCDFSLYGRTTYTNTDINVNKIKFCNTCYNRNYIIYNSYNGKWIVSSRETNEKFFII